MVKPLVLFTGFQTSEAVNSTSCSLVDYHDGRIFPDFIASGRVLRGTNHPIESEISAHIHNLKPDVVVNLGDLTCSTNTIRVPGFAMEGTLRRDSTLPIAAIMQQASCGLRADDLPPENALHNSAMAYTLAECRRNNILTAGLVELPAPSEAVRQMVYAIGQISVAFYRP